MAPPSLVELLGLDSVDTATEPNFLELLDRLWRSGYQGRVMLDFTGGEPRAVVIVQEVRFQLRSGLQRARSKKTA